jgi:hypothetical protein
VSKRTTYHTDELHVARIGALARIAKHAHAALISSASFLAEDPRPAYI